MSKSLLSITVFNEWYSNGNRMPDDKTVLIADFGYPPINIEEMSDEEICKFRNLVWYCITFHGGFPNAVIADKKNARKTT